MTSAEPILATAAHGRRLVGRTREMGEVGRALADVSEGRGRLLLLAGEPGIGKTSVADAATALAEARGFTVRWGRCWEAGGAPAYWPWLGVLGAISRVLDDERLVGALGDGAPVLAEILPELRHRLPPASSGARPPPEEARFRVFRAIAALIEAASDAEPHGLAIVLDDLHAADRSSLLLLHFLSRELRRLKVLVIATYRDVEARSDSETHELIQRIVREGTSLSLGRLGSGDAADLVQAQAASAGERVTSRIIERAQGNPLFLEEMLRLLAEQGPESIDAGVVPHGVRDVIGQRLGRVSPTTRAVLELCAVAGDEIDAPLLAATSGKDAAAITAALGEAMSAGVLAQRGAAKRWAHAIFREVLYRELDPTERALLHGRIAEALERAPPPGGSTPHGTIAHHALEGPAELCARGVEHAIQAAARAEELLAYDDAVATLEHALASATGKATPALRATLLIALGAACIRRGDGAAGRRYCREASAIAGELGDAELGARATLVYGRVFSFGSVEPVLVGMLEAALAALPETDSALRARLLARLAAALQPSTTVEEPINVARLAIATARRLGDKQTLLEVLHDAISALMDCAAPSEARTLNLEAEALARELGDRERLLRTQGRLFFLHLSYGELTLADARIEAYDALAKELAAPWLGYRSLFFRSVRALIHGRFAEAEQLLAEARRLGTALRDPQIDALAVRSHEALLRASERHDELLAPDSMARRGRDEYRFSAMWQALHAGIAHARREEPERAAFFYAQLPAAYPRNLYSFFFMTEMIAVAGTREQAQEVLQLVEGCPDEYLALGWTYVSWEGPRARFVALLLGRLGRYDEAAAAFEDAIARLTSLDAGPYLARSEYEYARLLAERNADGDAERARRLLESSRARALRLGMPGLVGHIDRRLAALGGAAGEAAPAARASAEPAALGAPAPGVALTREGEYFSVVYRGQTLRMKDSLGLRYLARLLDAPGKEIHVLELVREGRGASDPSQLADHGDAGELLDETARGKYKRRVEELEESLAEAESFSDTARAERARSELEFLARELGRAVGLGGQTRRAGAAAERARSAVQRRIRHAIERVGKESPALAKFLERSVRTGNYCIFLAVPD